MEPEHIYDVVIVGAGFSGLAAALHLKACGADTVVLEARGRVGGRSRTEDAGGPAYVDLGAGYVGPTQDAIVRLAANVGVPTYKVHSSGLNIFSCAGVRVEHTGTVPTLGPLALLDVNRLMVSTDDVCETIPIADPASAPDARTLDTMTAMEWGDRNALLRVAREAYRHVVRTVLWCEPSEVSALGWMWYVRSGGDVSRVINTDNGAQERKFVGGTQLVANRIAEQLGLAAETGAAGVVRLGSAVRSIVGWNSGMASKSYAERMASCSGRPPSSRSRTTDESPLGEDCQRCNINSPFQVESDGRTIPTCFGPVPAPLVGAPDYVTITTRTGTVVHSRYVIVAMAPTLYGRLEWDPPLPPILQQAVQRMPMGSCIKTHMFYRTAWWRERGYSGSFFSDAGPAAYTIDDCKPDGSRPCLMGFVVAGEQKRLARMTRSERIAALTAQYAELFRCPEALDPTDYLDADCEWPRCGGWRALHCLSLVRTVWGRRPSGVLRSALCLSVPLPGSEDPFSGGCPTSIMGPGFIAGEGRFWSAIRTPLGRVHWAGTETATHWTGYMAGAVEAGERAADEVLARLAAEQGPGSDGRIRHVPRPAVEAPHPQLPARASGPTAVERALPGPRLVLALTALAAVACVVAAIAAPLLAKKS